MNAEEQKLTDAATPLPPAESKLADSRDTPDQSGELFAPMKRDELVSYHARSFRLMFAITSVIAVNALIILASHYLTGWPSLPIKGMRLTIAAAVFLPLIAWDIGVMPSPRKSQNDCLLAAQRRVENRQSTVE